MASTLNALPVELIELIARNLEFQDLCSLRLVCRHVTKSLTPKFAKRYHHTICTNLSAQHLGDLEKLSTVGNYVKSLIISLCISKFEGWQHASWEKIGYGNTWYRNQAGQLHFPLDPVERLQHILSDGFINCKSFEIQLDLPEPREVTVEYITSNDTLAVLLTVFAKANWPVESFALHFGYTEVDIMRMPPTLSNELDFKILWSHLRELSLSVGLTEQNYEWMRKFIQGATQLRKMVLHLRTEQGQLKSPLTGQFFNDVIESWEDMPPLEEFELKGGNITVSGLAQFAARVGHSLHTMSLSMVRLREGGAGWDRALKEMGKLLIRLERFSVFALFDQNLRRVHFPGLLPPDMSLYQRDSWHIRTPGLYLVTRLWKRSVNGRSAIGVRFFRSETGMTLEALGTLATSRI